jgi:glycerophosphoryl diester phosphodiesterase
MFNKNGYVGRTEYNILKNYNYIKNGKKTAYTIDLLDEFLDKFKNTIRINLDAKTIHFFDFQFADQLISIINNHHLFHSIWISCFNPYLLQILKLKNNKIQTGYLFQRTAWLHIFYDKFCYTDAWHPHFNLINDKFVNKAKSLGKKLYIWTINSQDNLNQLKNITVDGIITDDVKLIANFF